MSMRMWMSMCVSGCSSTHRLVEVHAHVVDGVHQHLLQPPAQLVRVRLVLLCYVVDRSRGEMKEGVRRASSSHRDFFPPTHQSTPRNRHTDRRSMHYLQLVEVEVGQLVAGPAVPPAPRVLRRVDARHQRQRVLLYVWMDGCTVRVMSVGYGASEQNTPGIQSHPIQSYSNTRPYAQTHARTCMHRATPTAVRRCSW